MFQTDNWNLTEHLVSIRELDNAILALIQGYGIQGHYTVSLEVDEKPCLIRYASSQSKETRHGTRIILLYPLPSPFSIDHNQQWFPKGEYTATFRGYFSVFPSLKALIQQRLSLWKDTENPYSLSLCFSLN